ncbi:c-type cytochrome [Candidatus Methylacidiphilum infernorum]|uniref:Nitric-oxide reductase subunit C n=1 Tax=Methylacidiphilum infernorum (isolate V4) TaxID=481448 RepID=A9QPL3_METI4|nr:c-type cytochrome [Candidatus Methylacidiphilum infernorum]ABX56671.1 putative nitric oxide reductase C subunit [Methylacidiphilum infernorum V4]ACD82101.1 Nitric-oxide reductase subunit C [Methylacidiphilum infernorum V4]
MQLGWLEITLFSIVLTIVVSALFVRGKNWLDPGFWAVFALVGSLVMFSVLWLLTFDSLKKMSFGSKRVPSPTVINHRVGYSYDPDRKMFVPTIGEEELFFGKKWSEKEAFQLITKGKLAIQSRNCMDCHTLLGNGAYFAPDLTKSWLDPKWDTMIKPMVGAETKEEAISKWLQNPEYYATWQRRMPNLKIDDQEARAIVGYLKFMSAIDTNGFPDHFGQSALAY